MKNFVSEHRILVLVISGLAVLVVGSTIIGSFLLYHNFTGTTETSGCAISSAPQGKSLYVLSKSYLDHTVYLSAVNTNGQEHWTQKLVTLPIPSSGFLEEKNGLVYASVTGQVVQLKQVRPGLRVRQFGKIINIAAAYDANTGNKLWNIDIPANGLIDGMSICNDMMYLWTGNAIYAYNAKNGSFLWAVNRLTLLTMPRIVVTNNAIVFTGKGKDAYHYGIYALNPKNRALLWELDIPNRNPNGQYIALSLTATDKAVYISQFNGDSPEKVEALSISNGKSLWNTSVNMKLSNNVTGFPSTIVGNNILYLYINNRDLVALNVNNGNQMWEESNISQLQPLQDRLYVTHLQAFDFCQFDPTPGKSQWCKSPIRINYPIKAASNQTTLYVADTDGVSALQKDNGNVSWVYKGKTPGAALSQIYGLSPDY